MKQIALNLENPKIKNLDFYAEEYDATWKLEGEILNYKADDEESEELFIECLKYHKLLKHL